MISCFQANKPTVRAIRDTIVSLGGVHKLVTTGRGEVNLRHSFGHYNKYQQLQSMKQKGVRTTLDDHGLNRYIIRPLHHSRGVEFNVTDTMEEYDVRTHYHTFLFPKEWEYRVLGVGERTMTILKVPPEGARSDEAWGEGSYWMGVYNEYNNRLRHTTVRQDLNRFWSLYPDGPPLLWAADVLLSRDYKYAVCEMNMAPGVEVQRHREWVARNLMEVTGAFNADP